MITLNMSIIWSKIEVIARYFSFLFAPFFSTFLLTYISPYLPMYVNPVLIPVNCLYPDTNAASKPPK